MDRLRRETAAQHRDIEQVPYNRALFAGKITRAAYGCQLAAYREIHHALEERLASSAHPGVGAVFLDRMRRTPLIEDDLAALSVEAAPARSLDLAREVAREIRASDPRVLLGWLYVVEGSTLGGAVLHPRIVRALGLGDRGASSYLPYGRDMRARWCEFRARMEAAIVPEDEDTIVDGARAAFTRIADVLRAIDVGAPLAA